MGEGVQEPGGQGEGEGLPGNLWGVQGEQGPGGVLGGLGAENKKVKTSHMKKTLHSNYYYYTDCEGFDLLGGNRDRGGNNSSAGGWAHPE